MANSNSPDDTDCNIGKTLYTHIQVVYSEDEWNAFYESVLEPIGLQMSLEFSNKLFTPTEKNFGNEILFESNRLQYASNKTKIELLRYANNIMTINELREVLLNIFTERCGLPANITFSYREPEASKYRKQSDKKLCC